MSDGRSPGRRALDYLYGLVFFPTRMRNMARDLREILHLAKVQHARLDRKVDRLHRRLEQTRHTTNRIWAETRHLPALRIHFKQGGYELARQVYHRNLAAAAPKAPDDALDLGSRASTQAAIESDWFRYWMEALKVAPLAHRKLWEFAYILQNLHHRGMIAPGRAGLGFGCGEEPLPSFFAARGVDVTVTDLQPELVADRGWAETGQHTAGLMSAYKPALVDEATFRERVALKYVDMNDIPADLHGRYDFCWSVCALEHLGSIANGLDFIENSLKTLKPGGVAVHTTEFNYSQDRDTVDDGPTVLFLRSHFEEIAARLTAAGHEVGALDFDTGAEPLDAFVDTPPFAHRAIHLKLSVDGYPSTCFGITVRKAGATGGAPA